MALCKLEYRRAGEPLSLVRCNAAGLAICHFRRTSLHADAGLPDVNVIALWCDHSVWILVWLANHAVSEMSERRMSYS